MKLIIVLLMILNMIIPSKAMADNSSSAILIEAKSGEVLFEKNSEEKKYPASTTKIMTLILVYEAINNGQLSFNDSLTTSTYASSMGGSQIYLKEGEIMTVEDLLKSIVIASANDACVVLAEYIGGSVSLFVDKMNNKARELRLKNTNFVNCTGLHDDNHYTCAYDLAIMAKYLLEIGGDKLFQFTTLKEDYIRNNEFWLVNTNKLIGQSDMITGLKTGYTKEAKYCLVSTATKNGQSMISVVLDEPKAKIRNDEALELLNYGFSLYRNEKIFEKNQIIDQLYLPLTKEKNIDIYTDEDIIISVKKEQTSIPDYKISYHGKKSFMKGDHIADLICDNTNYPLYASCDATPLSFIERVSEVWLSLI